MNKQELVVAIERSFVSENDLMNEINVTDMLRYVGNGMSNMAKGLNSIAAALDGISRELAQHRPEGK